VGANGCEAGRQPIAGHEGRAAGRRVVGGHGSGHPRPRDCRPRAAPRRRCGSWWCPLASWGYADDDQQALAAVRTELTRLSGGIRGVCTLALPVRGHAGCGKGVTREPELEVVQERPMDGTPQARVADCVAPLRHDMLPRASDALVGG
jgi:hypothetical protein